MLLCKELSSREQTEHTSTSSSSARVKTDHLNGTGGKKITEVHSHTCTKRGRGRKRTERDAEKLYGRKTRDVQKEKERERKRQQSIEKKERLVGEIQKGLLSATVMA